MFTQIPRVVVAGTHSGVGKTTVATGIMAAFRRRGMRVQGFKVGPDFIDPTFHCAGTGRPSHNLDGWMLSGETNLEIFGRATKDMDVAVIEGVMGLFDGKNSQSLSGTTAEMVIWLDAAVALVLDASARAGSGAAVVHGSSYTLYGDPGLRSDRTSSIDGGIDQPLWNSRMLLSASYFYPRLNETIIFDSSDAINAVTDPRGRSGGYRNTGGGIARGTEFSASVAATRSVQLMGACAYTDSRQRAPLVAGVRRTYETLVHLNSMSATQRVTSRPTAFFAYAGSSDYLASLSGGAFQFDGPTSGQLGLSYRRPLGECRAIRFYSRADNLFNQTYFENGFRPPGRTITGGTQFEF